MTEKIAGHAMIKKEFLITVSKDGMDTKVEKEPITNGLNEKSTDILSTNNEVNKENGIAESENNKADEHENLEPPKKKKQKGQNKSRPRTVPKVEKASRLCPKLLQEEDCAYGDKCLFSHDIQKYLSAKPPDLGDKCINFELTGKCRYGLECRFSKNHIDSQFKNIIDKEKYEKYQSEKKYDNSLKRELVALLRKKKYHFPKTDAYLKSMKTNTCQEVLFDQTEQIENVGALVDDGKKKIDFSNKLYLAPLTTVGNLPFRRVCKRFGVDITCGEMAMSTQILQGHQSELALIKRHPCEDIFGVQICGGYPDTMTRCVELLNKECDVDFIDINLGCPIDLVFKKGEGSALMARLGKLETIVKGMVEVSDIPITLKMRTGIYQDKYIAHKLVSAAKDWGVSLMTMHGRSREQRYTREANWDYIDECAKLSQPIPFYGNGDILSYEEANLRRETTGVNGLMIARGALMKPWIFTEIKEQRHWDISSSERMDILRDFTNYGLEHWGSDSKGVESTRRFLLEWLSFLQRYIPVGLLEVVPQRINEKPPPFVGRNDLETLFASKNASDWVKISEMLLGPVPDNFTFLPKHKANSYSS